MSNPFLVTVRDVLATLLRRTGTSVASFMVAQGIPPESAEQALLAFSVLLGITFDLILSKLHENKQQAATLKPPLAANDAAREATI